MGWGGVGWGGVGIGWNPFQKYIIEENQKILTSVQNVKLMDGWTDGERQNIMPPDYSHPD